MKTGKVGRQTAVYEKAKDNSNFDRLPTAPLCCISWAGGALAAHAAMVIICLFSKDFGLEREGELNDKLLWSFPVRGQ